MEWYGVYKRELPWRGTHDPYRVWISEIMLQQTRVEAVKGYYSRFLEKFPTAQDLADADEEDVLKAWEGLGYYSRARNLHKAAKIIAETGFPTDFDGVRALPGIGDYTAGAICSIAYDLPCPAVDGNVLRILTRLLADDRNIDEQGTRTSFAEDLKKVYPKEAGDFCQALMELGAIICVPNGEPMCLICPWRDVCRAHNAGEEEAYPIRAEKKGRKIVKLDVYVLERDGKYALRKRGKTGLLAGLWEFPNYPVLAPSSSDEQSTSPALLPVPFKRVGKEGEILATKQAKHIFTHVEWHMTGYLVRADKSDAYDPQFIWATAAEIEENYALPSAFKAFKEWIK